MNTNYVYGLLLEPGEEEVIEADCLHYAPTLVGLEGVPPQELLKVPV